MGLLNQPIHTFSHGLHDRPLDFGDNSTLIWKVNPYLSVCLPPALSPSFREPSFDPFFFFFPVCIIVWGEGQGGGASDLTKSSTRNQPDQRHSVECVVVKWFQIMLNIKAQWLVSSVHHGVALIQKEKKKTKKHKYILDVPPSCQQTQLWLAPALICCSSSVFPKLFPKVTNLGDPSQ